MVRRVNAKALPGGYLYLTRKAAADLDTDALLLVLGHEVAHVAKRHTSKQIQQRLVDNGAAVEVFQGMMSGRTFGSQTLGNAEAASKRVQGVWARYDQNQEFQADACAIRSLVDNGKDALEAREDYLLKRGKQRDLAVARTRTAQPMTEHPTDQERNQFYRAAYNHHKSQLAKASPR